MTGREVQGELNLGPDSELGFITTFKGGRQTKVNSASSLQGLELHSVQLESLLGGKKKHLNVCADGKASKAVWFRMRVVCNVTRKHHESG